MMLTMELIFDTSTSVDEVIDYVLLLQSFNHLDVVLLPSFTTLEFDLEFVTRKRSNRIIFPLGHLTALDI